MKKQSRREFFKTVSAAAASVAVPAGAEATAQRDAYGPAVRSEPSLLGYWPLRGDLQEARGGPAGAVHGGEAAFLPGPIAFPAVALDRDRFITVEPLPQYDTEEATVELFFQVTAPPSRPYNPCLIARRASSPDTRFSLHVNRDLSSLAVWNGQAVATVSLPDGPVRVGRWYHVALVSTPTALRAWVDGVACEVAGAAAFNRARKGRPLVIAASSPAGEEAAACAIAEVALYGAALTAESIARHVDAAGWGERRRRLARDRERREQESRRARREKTAKRLNDPRLFAAGAPRVYRDERLTGIRFTLGGIGAGCIQMDGRAERAAWQIFNNFAGAALPDSFFAVRAGAVGSRPVARALQTTKVGPFPAMKALAFRGEVPFAWYDFEDAALPVRVRMEAFTPFVPLEEKDSALPCAVFALTAENPSDAAVEVAFLAAQQNAVGFTGDGPILGRRGGSYGGNRNRVLRENGAAILHMTSDRDPQAPGSGDMALAALAEEADGIAAWPGLKALSDLFTGEGGAPALPEAGPSPAGETLDGALVAPFRLGPGEKRTVRFVLTWRFPNARHGGEIPGWEHAGNLYASWWPSALDLARHLVADLDRLTAETRLFHDTFYRSNLPWWLKDRITSQLAILRSKTCFWAGDGYFGVWEGCAPGGGCCAGNCTHVWHYAQAHARLFPGIARRMRDETFRYQHADGSLPHRHPGLPPALDGQCGDILGAWREHLCSADGAWLAEQWPRVKRAMEQTISRWDADEDGVLAGAQWNTLDGELGGSTTWIGSLYLSALAASEKMAEIRGDGAFAARCRRIRESGARRQNETLWNGEYYVQIPDPQPRQDYDGGCAIDQLLGEWWARQVGLEPHYPEDRARAALASLIRYNFRPDFHGVAQAPRKFVDEGDAGLQMIQWPRGDRPNPCILYGDEVMTGFEYAAAATMVQQGMLREGFMVALAVSDRYDGRLRSGLTPGGTASWGYSGNPFGDDECGKFYARAMSVWSLLLACQGFHHDGPAGVIGFAPVWKPENHVSFFTSAEGWGLFTQKRAGGRQRERVELARGRLRLREMVIALPGGSLPGSVRVTAAGRPLPARHAVEDGRLTVTLESETVLAAGEVLEVVIA